MFSSAFKSFSSNINSTYDVAKQPTATSGAWTIFDGKKKSTGAQASVFVFDRKLLEVQSNGLDRRASSTSIRKIQDEVVERLRKEASSLARLRHPSILQLVEPVEDTRNGGLMFATEPIIASLSGALAQKDQKERASSGRRDTRDYGLSPASRASQDVDLDELEIQKGLLQLAKGLEFLHDSAKLVHGNLTPDAIFINAKSDWKISGLSFAGPPDGAEGHQPVPQISLSEVLHHDSRIPPTVQLNLDYASPDFVLDSNVNFSADIFSLGLVILACYRNPHTSPIETHGNQSTYKKVFNSSSTAPSSSNNYLCSTKLPNELEQVLPRILARRPTQRMNAAEFQQSEYFDNILVNTMRFLDGLPAKTPAEKSQFMRGLQRVMPQFPVSVLGKKILIALLDEMKDKDLLGLILENIFLILGKIPNRQEALSDKVLPRLRDTFLTKSKSEERDTSKEAGLNVFLSHIKLVADNTTAKQFKDDALPIVHFAMDSATHSIVDAALHTLSVILPVLDFSTVKHDLFPVIANVFSKTSSLGIKVGGLEALAVLCGASEERPIRDDDLAGVVLQEQPKSNTSSLDKFTMQEKVVPLLKAIKTKEPAVMMAALRVFQQVVRVGDIDFLAIEVMPILWAFALGPLLDLNQFKSYMETIRSLSGKIEREQMRKLQELSSSTARTEPTRSKSSAFTTQVNGGSAAEAEENFEKLVLGNRTHEQKNIFDGVTSDVQKLTPNPPTFSWSSNAGSTPATRHMGSGGGSALQPAQPVSRSVTPDVQMSTFPSLQPASFPSQAGSHSAWAISTPTHNPASQSTTLHHQRSPGSSQPPAPNYTSAFVTTNVSQSATTTAPTNPWSPTSNHNSNNNNNTTTTNRNGNSNGHINSSRSAAWSIASPPPPPPPPPSQSTLGGFTPMIAPPPGIKPPPTLQPQPLQPPQPNYSSFGMNMNMNTLSHLQSAQPQERAFAPPPFVQQQRQQQQQQPPPPQRPTQKTGLDKYESLL